MALVYFSFGIKIIFFPVHWAVAVLDLQFRSCSQPSAGRSARQLPSIQHSDTRGNGPRPRRKPVFGRRNRVRTRGATHAGVEQHARRAVLNLSRLLRQLSLLRVRCVTSDGGFSRPRRVSDSLPSRAAVTASDVFRPRTRTRPQRHEPPTYRPDRPMMGQRAPTSSGHRQPSVAVAVAVIVAVLASTADAAGRVKRQLPPIEQGNQVIDNIFQVRRRRFFVLDTLCRVALCADRCVVKHIGETKNVIAFFRGL